MRRVGELCILFSEAGTVALPTFISPLSNDRVQIRSRLF